MPIDPGALGWQVDARSGFVGAIGPVWFRADSEPAQFGFVAEAKHLNGNGTVHGGMLLSLLDHAFGMAVVRALRGSLAATIQFNAQFLGGVAAGEFVETDCTILKRTRSLLFVRGECRVKDAIVVAADGVFKILGSPAASHTKETLAV